MEIYEMKQKVQPREFVIFDDTEQGRNDLIFWMTLKGAQDIEFYVWDHGLPGPASDGGRPKVYEVDYTAFSDSFPYNDKFLVSHGSYVYFYLKDRIQYFGVMNRYAGDAKDWHFYKPSDMLTEEEKREGWRDFGWHLGFPNYVAIDFTERLDEGGLPVGERINWDRTLTNFFAESVLKNIKENYD